MKSILFLGMAVLISCSTGTSAHEDNLLKPTDFQKKMMSTPDAVLLDVRTPEEVKTGYIRGAINFDFKGEQFKLLVSGLDKTKSYFIYCAAGSRSSKAATQMTDMGFSKIYTLDGGLKAWNAEGLPVKIPPQSN